MGTNTKGNAILSSFDKGFVFVSFFSVFYVGLFAFAFLHCVFNFRFL